ncbi:hypothetical protein [Paenibacillus glycanilyticus]|uniref:ABC transporter domain-containing protein n=1 Tax=Paenibacillus glycanilyticus TaxID=126569 RepID=A0ABQ6GAL8_9BACL|nr:hypothetical protein [Paenibacillus glycanilyticus]GLX68014.1 hypothetical protein MU1_23590 [Paenibacillus glycanilyticus]
MIRELSVQNISARCTPSSFNIGSFRDEIKDFSYTFKSGCVYGIIGQPGQGAWALSYLLTGQIKRYSGKILADETIVNPQWLESNSMYIGEELPRNRWLRGSNRTIRQQLMDGSSSYTVGEIVELLELSPSRLDRTIKQISNERWNASVGIGLAHQKVAYCFPWFNADFKEINRARLSLCSNVLKTQKTITIIPSDETSNLENIADEFIYI